MRTHLAKLKLITVLMLSLNAYPLQAANAQVNETNTNNAHANKVGGLAELTQTLQLEALFNAQVDSARLQQLTAQLTPGATATGEFTQYRRLKVLKKPLVSQGQFIFDAQLGLVWQQTHPFNTSLILKDDVLIQIDSTGKRQISKAADSQGASALAQTLPKLLTALLTGRLNELEAQFNFFLLQAVIQDEPQSDWQLGLIPIDSLMKRAIPKLVLEGNSQVTKLILISANGDSSTIEFSQISNAPLTQAQLHLLSGEDIGPAAIDNHAR